MTEDHPVVSKKYGVLHFFAFFLVMAGAAVVLYKMPLSVTRNFKADVPQTYTVTNTNNSGAGSLRDAITNANSNAAGDTIAFSVSGTITLSSVLPNLTDAQSVTIDGTTAPDDLAGPDIKIVGSNANDYGVLIFDVGNKNIIKGIALSGPSGHTGGCLVVAGTGMMIGGTGARDGNTMDGCARGISVEYGSNVTIYNNTIGATAANSGSGISMIGASNVTIGGAGTNQRNFLVQNGANGIAFGGSNASNLTVKGNYIGTLTGSDDKGNGSGILIDNGSSNVTIGGTTAAERNIISGNDSIGISVWTGATTVVIQGNYIGLNAAGTAALSNGTGVSAVSTTTIGGTAAGVGNVISGNTSNGISLSTAQNSIVQGNIIGLNPAGTAAIANGGHGIYIESSNHTIGGTTTSARNVISGNSLSGININGGFGGATGNTIEMNYIGTNAAGTAAIANGNMGIYVVGGAQSNNVGVASYGNVVSGNTLDGIRIEGATTTSNSIQGNTVGLGANGSTAIGNGANGIQVWANNTQVGTINNNNARNIISSNGGYGILFSVASNNTIVNNYIGLASDGTTVRANTDQAIIIASSSASNTIGGTATGAGNTIAAASTKNCIYVHPDAGNFNNLRANHCPTESSTMPNIGRDGTGNEDIANPTLTSATATTSYVEGTAVANGKIDLFVNGLYLASASANGSGVWSKALSIPVGGKVSVSATNATNSTSRTSTPQVTVANDTTNPTQPIVVNPAIDSSVNTGTITLTGTKEVNTSILVNGVERVPNDALTTWTISNFVLSEGLNTFSILAKDFSSNSSTSLTYKITYAPLKVYFSTATQSVAESVGNVTITLQLSSAVTADVTVPYTVTGTAIGGDGDYTNLSNGTIIVSTGQIMVTKSFSVVSDFVDEDNETVILTLGTPNYGSANGITVQTITITDDDTAGVTVSAISGNTTEAGGTATFTVVLMSQPTPSASIALSSSDTTEGTLSVSSLTFTNLNWNTLQTVTVTGVDDSIDDGDITFSVITGAVTSSDGKYNGINPSDVTVINTDDDSAPTTAPSTTNSYGGGGGSGTSESSPSESTVDTTSSTEDTTSDDESSSTDGSSADSTTSGESSGGGSDQPSDGGTANNTSGGSDEVAHIKNSTQKDALKPIKTPQKEKEISSEKPSQNTIKEKKPLRAVVDAALGTTVKEGDAPKWWLEMNNLSKEDFTATEDSDGDGVNNVDEYTYGTNPGSTDTDNDQLTDAVEVAGGTDPLQADSDDDGLSDYAETVNATDPHNVDTDGDGYTDGEEAGSHESDPTNALSIPYDADKDGYTEHYTGAKGGTIDSDGDGITDILEYEDHTDPHTADTDGDGVNDGTETLVYGTNPLIADEKKDHRTFIANWKNGDTSADNQPLVIGIAPSGSRVELVYVQDSFSALLGVGTTGVDGTFAIQTETALLDGAYYLFARSRDASDGSTISEAYPVKITIDTTTTDTNSVNPTKLDGKTITDGETLTVTSVRPLLEVQSQLGLTVTVYWKSFLLASAVLADIDPWQTVPTQDLEIGSHTIYLQAEDANHVKGKMQEVRFETAPPSILHASYEDHTSFIVTLLGLLGVLAVICMACHKQKCDCEELS